MFYMYDAYFNNCIWKLIWYGEQGFGDSWHFFTIRIEITVGFIIIKTMLTDQIEQLVNFYAPAYLWTIQFHLYASPLRIYLYYLEGSSELLLSMCEKNRGFASYLFFMKYLDVGHTF